MPNGSGPSGVLHAASGGGTIAGDTMVMLIGSAERTTTWPPVRRKQDWRLSLAGAVLVHVCLFVLILSASAPGHRHVPALPRIVEVSLYAIEEPASKTPAVQPAPLREAPPRSAPVARRARNNSPASAAPLPADAEAAQNGSTASRPPPPPIQQEGASPQTLTEQAGGSTRTGTAATGTEASEETPARPRYRENPPPSYPEQARRRRLEGTVVLEALVGGKGKVDDLTVHASSGHQLLDEAALRAVRDWLFEPGQRGGMPVTAKVLVPVRFVLR